MYINILCIYSIICFSIRIYNKTVFCKSVGRRKLIDQQISIAHSPSQI